MNQSLGDAAVLNSQGKGRIQTFLLHYIITADIILHCDNLFAADSNLQIICQKYLEISSRFSGFHNPIVQESLLSNKQISNKEINSYSKALSMLRKYAFPFRDTNKDGGLCFGSLVLHVNYNLSIKEKPIAMLCCNRKMREGVLCLCKIPLFVFCKCLNQQIFFFMQENRSAVKVCSSVAAH